MSRVLCNAYIESVTDDGKYKEYTVVVSGVGDHDGIVHKYNITGGDEDSAATEAIRRFVKEHEK